MRQAHHLPTLDLLFRFLSQNEGKLPNRACEKEFLVLTPEEMERVEAMYSNIFLNETILSNALHPSRLGRRD